MTAPHDSTWCLTSGKPFIDGITFWQERYEYKIFNGTHLLLLCTGRLMPSVAAACHLGQIHLGLFLKGDVIFVLFKIDGLYNLSDQVFSMELVKEAERDVGIHENGQYQLLYLVLVEAETRLVAGLHLVTWSSRASTVLHRAWMAQMPVTFYPKRHQDIVATIYMQYLMSQDLACSVNLREQAGTTL